MKKMTKVISLAVTAGIAIAVVMLVQKRSEHEEASHEQKPAAAHEPGIVRFSAGAPQLNSIRTAICLLLLML